MTTLTRPALLRRTIGAMGFAASLVVGVAAPVGFALEEYGEAEQAAEAAARGSAARLARYVHGHGDTWTHHHVRLVELLEAARAEGEAAAARAVHDAAGRLVVAEGAPPPGPTLTRSAPIRVIGADVGRVDVSISLRPLMIEGGLVALLGAALGGLALFVGRVVPLRILDGALGELEATAGALRERNLRFDAAIEGMAHGLCMFGPDERMIVCNGHYLQMFGLSRAVVVPGVSLRDVLEHSVSVGIASEEAEALYVERKAFIARREPATYHETLSDGRVVAISHRPMADGGWVAIYEDVTDQLRVVEGVREQNRRFDAALANMGQGLLMFDADARLLVRNQRFLELLGLDALDIHPGQSHAEVIGRMIAAGPYAGLDVETVLDGFRRRLASGDTGPFFREFADGRVVAVIHRPMAGGGWVTTFEDVTEQRRSEAQIAHMARHDGLTGLPNRAALGDHLLRILAAADRGGPPVAVLCLDLDRFKSVNDTLGHAVGDALLKAVAERLLATAAAVGQSRGALVARLGGDEFAIALSAETADPDDARALPDALARRLIKALSAPFDLHGHRVLVGTSVGVALAPAHGKDPEQLLCNADLALCRAKAEARGTCRVFEPEMDARMQKRRALELDLRQALARGEFELHYQPVLHLGSMRVASVEALLRWHHPERGLISPSEFIPIAEEIGLVAPIDDWVLRQACLDAAGWRRPVKVAVNLSPAQFKGRDLAGGVVRALAASGLSASRLELEITESVLLMENEATLDTLHRLRSFGVRIALDDFGVGYSSLSYLRSFPFDRIKIDRSFVRDLGVKSDCLAIVRAVTGLAADLGMESTAEGVETADQLARVRAEGVTHVQGFLFSRPFPAREVDALLAGLEPAGVRAA